MRVEHALSRDPQSRDGLCSWHRVVGAGKQKTASGEFEWRYNERDARRLVPSTAPRLRPTKVREALTPAERLLLSGTQVHAPRQKSTTAPSTQHTPMRVKRSEVTVEVCTAPPPLKEAVAIPVLNDAVADSEENSTPVIEVDVTPRSLSGLVVDEQQNEGEVEASKASSKIPIDDVSDTEHLPTDLSEPAPVTTMSCRVPTAYERARQIIEYRAAGRSYDWIERRLKLAHVEVRLLPKLTALATSLVPELFDFEDGQGGLLLTAAYVLVRVPPSVQLKIWRRHGPNLSVAIAKREVQIALLEEALAK